MKLSALDILKRKQRERAQKRAQGITDATKQKLEARRAQHETNQETATTTQATKPPPPKTIAVTGAGAALLGRLKPTAPPTVPVVEDEPPPQDALAYTPNGDVEVAVTVHTGEQVLGKNDITLDMFNAKQLEAVERASRGESFCLIGGAGTGKTTTQKGIISSLMASGKIGTLEVSTEKVLRAGAPSVAVISFTNKAVSNIKSSLPEVFKSHCSTIHKLLEYKPEEFELDIVDAYGAPTGETKTSRRFIPTYGTTKEGHGDDAILPPLDVIIVEEAGSVPTELFDILLKALPTKEETVFIKLGDLNQLPPVFGDAVLGYALLDLPIVELTEVYRQALKSPITRLATTIQKGRGIRDAALAEMAGDFGEHGILEVKPFKPVANKLNSTPEDRARMAYNFGKVLYDLTITGEFNPDTDAVLVPFNKAFGTMELNKWVGQALRDMKDLVTYHILAGRDEYFLCEEDRVMYDKQECIITGIEVNDKYLGNPTIVASKDIDRWGRNTGKDLLKREYKSFDELADALDDISIQDTEDKVNQCSHIITVESLENEGQTFTLNTAAQVNTLLPLNVLTVHKSQGSEWRKVLLVLHTSHASMWNRELIYTAVTRARHHLVIYYSGEQAGKINGSAFQRGVIKSEFNGITLEKKLDYFRNKRRVQELNSKHRAA